MRVYLDYNEFYPFYDWEVDQGDGDPHFGRCPVNIPEEQLQKWRRVMDEFFEVQKEIRQYHDADIKRREQERAKKKEKEED